MFGSPIVAADTGGEVRFASELGGMPVKNCSNLSRQAAGVKPVPTLLATMRHFSFS
jgi:hypothetical protein